MPTHCPRLLIAALLFVPPLSAASLVNRCEDAQGNITFTTLACPTGHERTVQHAYNPPPGGGPAILPPAERHGGFSGRSVSRSTGDKEILVVGEWQDGCGNRLSAEQRRKAIMNRQTPPGMTRRDVESMLGKPDTIANRNGELHYTYKKTQEGRSNSVVFDPDGCVKSKK